MATGRSRALLGFGVAHFVVYIAVVLFASSWGVTGVAIAASGVHLAFVVVAYRCSCTAARRRRCASSGQDVSAAIVSCAAMAAAACRSSWRCGAPAHARSCTWSSSAPCGGSVYLAALRLWFKDAWSDLSALLRRVAAGRGRVRSPRESRGPRRVERGESRICTTSPAQRQRRHPLLQVRPLPAGLRAQRARSGGRRRPRPDHRRRFARRQRAGGARPAGRRGRASRPASTRSTRATSRPTTRGCSSGPTGTTRS